MKALRLSILALAISAVSAPAWAQTMVSASGAQAGMASQATAATKKSLADRIANRLMPAGIYKKLMSGPMQQMMGGMTGELRKLPLRELAAMGSVSQDKLDQMGDAQLGEILAIMDPHFEERTTTMMNAMFTEMGGIMETLEPDMREGMAEAYASQFSLDQLTELDRFFATPTGALYGEKSTLIMTDPAIVSRMQKAMPMIMQEMPAMMKAAMAATDKLPPPRRAKDLTVAERKRLEAIFGK